MLAPYSMMPSTVIRAGMISWAHSLPNSIRVSTSEHMTYYPKLSWMILGFSEYIAGYFIAIGSQGKHSNAHQKRMRRGQ